MTGLLVFLVWLNSINWNAIHGLGSSTETCFRLLLLLFILSWKLFLERNYPWKGCPGRQSVSSFTFLWNLKKNCNHDAFNENYPSKPFTTTSSEWILKLPITDGTRGRRDSQLALKHVFLIIEKQSHKRERKESKPFVCWCSVTEIHAIMVHEIGKYCNETGYFCLCPFCARNISLLYDFNCHRSEVDVFTSNASWTSDCGTR